ncbi:MAG: NAD-dependent succinate-semialdehyde dehydrogenase [Comamonas sp.]|nr:NAD-dependent succinate-semialdehyde dehydrogenase [Comamonas sp.]
MADTQPTYPFVQLLIDGAWQDAASGATLEVTNPATAQVLGHVACADETDLQRAVAAAQRGFTVWRWMSAHERQAILRRAAGLLRERADTIATLMTLEQGKPLPEALVEVRAGADIIEWFADEGLRLYGRLVPCRRGDVQQLVLQEPVGPVAAFTPWNFPINQIVRKLGAALAAGCSFLCKAPEDTPASPAELLRCFVDAGIPPGVVGLVYGNPAQISQYLIAHPAIRKITFTGSTAVGKQLAALAGQHMKRCTMELGGHAPVIVAEDADLALVLKAIGPAKLRNAGQVCISPTRFLVHRSVQAPLVEQLAAYFADAKVGNGLEADVQMGPLAHARRVAAMQQLVADAQAHGAQVPVGGRALAGPGNFFAPTLLVDAPQQAAVCNTEPFGPLAVVRGFDQLDEAIAEANRLPYGLAAYAFTRSMHTAHLLGQRVETGMLWINQAALTSAELPFGGTKDSGYGSEGGPEALQPYLTPKVVSTAMV